jgi:hypothetical protein
MKRWESEINGEYVNEDDINWEFVKDKVDLLSLNINGQKISLPKGMEYIQGKTASAFIGSGNIDIESRYIGFYHKGEKIIIRVDEKTNNINIEIKA